MSTSDPLVISFRSTVAPQDTPSTFPNPFQTAPHPLALRAAQELQETLPARAWQHDFGLGTDQEGQAIGKMFGVLVVQASDGAIGYLAAFSGKLGDQHLYTGFVPPVCDGLLPGGFLHAGMKKLDALNLSIQALSAAASAADKRQALTEARRAHSNSLQDQIYDGYHFLNQAGLSKSLRTIFHETLHTNPPGGAGDCAAPKLLQYAFLHQLKPLALAEFWWGYSTNAPQWQHQQYYPACTHKCAPILQHMLAGLMEG
jgi:tRNA pseudouridine32 synthase/23S rRNA pseudouridine746 synthase